MQHRRSTDARDQDDLSVEQKILTLRQSIEAWGKSKDLWFDTGFTDYLPHTGREPSSLPVLTRLWSEGGLARILMGDGPAEIEVEFRELLEQHNCWYEFDTHCVLDIYPDDESDYSDFTSYFHWQWVCSLVKQDIGDVYAELFSHFASRPNDLYSLSWRDYEVLLAEIFKTQGFAVELGPGTNDGGVDITLIQRDPIGDLMTLVQAKKYAPHNKIGLTEVQALFGAQTADGASKSLFVTTSKYAPVAKRFAARETVGMSLATSDEVSSWCDIATNGIIEDKSSLVSRDSVLKIFREIGERRDARLVHASSGYNVNRNEFAVVIKESKHAALLMSVSNSVVSHDGFGQAGFEVPNLDPTLPNHNHDGVVRARRREEDGRVSYWDGHHLYSQWDGNPANFDLYD